MTGIQVSDTYGPVLGVDQLCECIVSDAIRVGDTVVLDTGWGPLPFEVALLEYYLDEHGYASTVTGVGLLGLDSELVMPGDTLRIVSMSVSEPVTTTSVHVTVDENQQVEIQRQLLAV